MGMYWMRERGL
jgi:hypothetical protein